MGSVPQLLQRAATVLALLAAASCSAAPAGTPSARTAPAGAPSASATPAGPLTAAINQFRDNYSKQIIEIQLTNTTDKTVTVRAAVVQSPLFQAGISWTSAGAGTELPPGQTKSLPALLPPASCPGPRPDASEPATAAGATVRIQVAPESGAEEPVTAAADPFGVLARNQAELCLAQAAAAVAVFRFSPDLEVAADGRTGVLRLEIMPRNHAGAAGDGPGDGSGSLTIDSIAGTTLLEEDPGAPWPAGLWVHSTGPASTVRLGIRPARCDPHAVAEDKVGTLIPVRVTVGGREGVLKVDAGTQLRGRLYSFVTSACGRQ
ncbi:hypothetical protein [Arthrobacter sp. B3I4]|uniref:hypothetical protein n=1 Tax=Arthrobacter sp. B3I4 TaxID=3042267 RepID=UPI00277D639A|nr:hypothetical protein [Arthrobacter sp. B3I4]MDQ0756422.1 hypothetical protein [Arthrobacter sp. B3I4]